MPVSRLTDTAIRKAINDAREKGGQPEIIDAATPGLRIRANRSGRATWSIMVRDQAGRNRRVNLGEYPTLGIADARREADRARHRIRYEGADPTEERRKSRQKDEGVITLGDVVAQYGQHVGSNRKSWPDAQRRITSVFGNLIAKPAAEVSRAELQIAADEWLSRQSASAAIRYIRPILKWGSAREYVSETASLLKPPETVQKRSRSLSIEELARLLPVLRRSQRPHAKAMLFMMLTATRREEAAGATWREIDLDKAIWVIPASRTKNTRPSAIREPHIVPLSRQALDLVQQMRPETPNPNAFVFPTSSGRLLGNWDKETKRIQRESETEDWHRHDLRRTAATTMGELGVAPYVIEAALNHADIHSPLAGVYNRARYTVEVGEALQRLADRLDAILPAP